jgi:hypothetical protein
VLEALGLGASSGAGQAHDLLVVVHQRVEQFLAEYSRPSASSTSSIMLSLRRAFALQASE